MIKKLLLYRKLLLYGFFFCLTCLPFNLQAQSLQRQGISSYGSTGLNGSSILIQTVGQPYNTAASYGSGISITPGFLQPLVFEIKDVTPEPIRRLNLNVFPNPATYFVTIKSSESIENPSIRIIDMQGKTVLDHRVDNLQDYTINCETWPNGIYIITVSDGNQTLSSLKLIIKK